MFGEMDEEEQEVFSTPLAVTRASSRAADTPSVDGGPRSGTDSPAHDAGAEGQGSTHTAAAPLDTEALQQQLASAAVAVGDVTQVAAQEQAPPDSIAPLDADAPAAAPAAAAADEAPALVSAPSAADPQQVAAADAVPEPAALPATGSSGLLSLAELSLHSKDGAGSSSTEQQQQHPASPSSPSAVSTASSDTSVTADDDAAGAEAPGDPAVAAIEAAAAAAGGAAGSPSSSGRQVHHACSPIQTHGSAGLERAPSWQLQHAAATAAGTAAHPAPPRSDMDLAKLRWGLV